MVTAYTTRSAKSKEYPIAFWLPRANHLKIFGPIMDAQKRRGFESLLIVPALADPKSDQFMPHPIDTVRVHDGQELIQLANRVRWITSVGLRTPPTYRRAFSQLRASGVKLASVDHIQESLLQILEDGPTLLDGWDLVTTASPEGLHALAEALGPGQSPSWNGRTIWAIGTSSLDPLAGMDKVACRAKWNLPAGRIVLLAPAARPALLNDFHWRCYASPIPSVGAFAWRLWSGEWLMPYREILRSFRRWADRHGAYVVAKVRAKTPCLGALDGIADHVIGDEAFHPFTTLELCRAADAYVGLASAMAIEATAAGLPQVHVLAYPSEAYEVPAYLPFRQRFYLDVDKPWDGLWGWPYETFRDVGRRLFDLWVQDGEWPSSAPNLDALARLAGPQDGRASERFLDLLADSS